MTDGLIFTYFTIFTLVLVGITFYGFRRLFCIIEVDGCSMVPYLISGDRALIAKYYPPILIKRGSVILFESWPTTIASSKDYFIKRVVGLPNDTLGIYETELITLKGTLSEGNYNYYLSIYPPNTLVTSLTRTCDSDIFRINQLFIKNYRTVKVPPGHFFVKGDWLFGGDDSIIHGPIHWKKIIGVMLIKLNH